MVLQFCTITNNIPKNASYIYSYSSVGLFLNSILELELLAHRAFTFPFFLGNTEFFSIVIVLIYTPISV